jgi:hypothetical protein
VYAGCVYWPFHGHTTIGSILVAVILVGGVIEATVRMLREGRKPPAAQETG